MQYGRQEIWTDVPEITTDNIIKVLQNALPVHEANAIRIRELLDFDAGIQPLQREKTYRPDINIECVDNVANEVTEFKLGFQWGYPITLIQRGEEDSGGEDETRGIAELNECYQAEGINSKHQALGRYVEVGGIGYTFVDIKTDWMPGDSYFTVEALNPCMTFVVRSSYYIDHRVMLGVTYRVDSNGMRHFTAYSKDKRYDISEGFKIENGKYVATEDWQQGRRSGDPNPLGMIPIIEWIRSHDRMGCFERVISECNNLNILISDFSNDVDQNTQAIWHGNDISFPKDAETGKEVRPSSNDWVVTQTTADGKQPFIKPLTIDTDYDGILNSIVTRRSLILQKCNVPQRNDNSGGSTGVAMSDATGWSSAETAACKQQSLMESAKMDEVKVVLRAIQLSPNVPADSPLLKLRYIDMMPNIKRQKTYELATKSNALATLLKNGVYGLHALKTVNLFEDVNQVWEDSKDLIEELQRSNVKDESADHLNQDESDQIANSPMIDGMSKEDPNGGTAA